MNSTVKKILTTLLYWIIQAFLHTWNFFSVSLMLILHGRKGKIVPPIQNHLLLKSATKLAEDIRGGQLKSEEIVQAYIDRILEVEPYVNGTAVCCFEDALKQAREVDTLIASKKYTNEQLAETKPLLGVPLTVKCVFRVKGFPSTAGSKILENEIAPEDAAAVTSMKNAGAIIIATTNIAEFAMHFETTNKLYGKTTNPYDTNRTSGGSSGGECALIASGASVLGLANDLCGSIRIPANFTGTFGHKATGGLTCTDGSVPMTKLDDSPKEKLEQYLSTGPICRYAEDLVISMRILCTDEEVKMTLGKKVNFNKLKVCYITGFRSYGILPVDEDIVLGIRNAATYFEKNYNIKTEEIKPTSFMNGGWCYLHKLIVNTNDTIKAATCGKPVDFDIKLDFLKSLFGKSTISIVPLFYLNLSYVPAWRREDVTLYFESLVQKWIQEFDDILDEDTVLFMPTFPITAPYCSTMPLLGMAAFYTTLFNMTEFPVTQCPIGFDKQGLPFGIQIVGRKNNDALTIACAAELEKAFGGWKSPGTAQNV